jgi:hypothetical protein
MLWLVVLTVLTVTASSARAQTWTPFGPSDMRYDLELFKAPDISDYPNWPHPKDGFFFQYERLYMSIQQPFSTDIGVHNATATGFFSGPVQFDPTTQPVSEILRPYGNSLDTNFLGAKQTWGNRFELGFMDDNKGWFVSILNLNPQVQSYTAGSANTPAGLTVVFNDPQHLLLGFVDNGGGFDSDLNANPFLTADPFTKVPYVFGRPRLGANTSNLSITGLPVPTIGSYAGFTDFGDEVPLVPLFNTISIRNITSMNGVELNRSWRLPIFHDGGIWEPFVGLRWLQLRDEFDVTATNTEGGDAAGNDIPTAFPGTSFWDTKVDNNMFGPQIGFRAEHSAGRFNLMGEMRFMAAVNFQSTNLDGELGSALSSGDTVVNEPLLMPHTSFHLSRFDETFAPVGEIRAGVNYQLTNAIGVQAEYNTMLGTGVSRAARRVAYTLPSMGITDYASEPFFTQGISMGITINR